jgi:hypothetical protein
MQGHEGKNDGNCGLKSKNPILFWFFYKLMNWRCHFTSVLHVIYDYGRQHCDIATSAMANLSATRWRLKGVLAKTRETKCLEILRWNPNVYVIPVPLALHSRSNSLHRLSDLPYMSEPFARRSLCNVNKENVSSKHTHTYRHLCPYAYTHDHQLLSLPYMIRPSANQSHILMPICICICRHMYAIHIWSSIAGHSIHDQTCCTSIFF